jgi:predicted O-linked N-acetylglucosamine transferase (SPINDLY family)
MVTLAGRTFASRVAGSLLHEMGLDDLITTEVSAYEDLALALATQPARLTALRQRVEAGRVASSLFDGSRIALRLEELYGRMWARALKGLAPDHLPA